MRNFDFSILRNNDNKLFEYIKNKYEYKKYVKNAKEPDPMTVVINKFKSGKLSKKTSEKSIEPKYSNYYMQGEDLIDDSIPDTTKFNSDHHQRMNYNINTNQSDLVQKRLRYSSMDKVVSQQPVIQNVNNFYNTSNFNNFNNTGFNTNVVFNNNNQQNVLNQFQYTNNIKNSFRNNSNYKGNNSNYYNNGYGSQIMFNFNQTAQHNTFKGIDPFQQFIK